METQRLFYFLQFGVFSFQKLTTWRHRSWYLSLVSVCTCSFHIQSNSKYIDQYLFLAFISNCQREREKVINIQLDIISFFLNSNIHYK